MNRDDDAQRSSAEAGEPDGFLLLAIYLAAAAAEAAERGLDAPTLSHEQIAAIAGVSRGTVQNLEARALAKMRRRLRSRDHALYTDPSR